MFRKRRVFGKDYPDSSTKALTEKSSLVDLENPFRRDFLASENGTQPESPEFSSIDPGHSWGTDWRHMSTRVRHILSLSGGKDSTALAVLMKGKIPNVEYVFCDTGKELEETYEYLKRVEAFLGEPIIYLNAERGFDHWLENFGKLLTLATGALVHAKAQDCPL